MLTTAWVKPVTSAEAPITNSRGLLAGHHSPSDLPTMLPSLSGPDHRHRWPVRLAGFRPALRPSTASSLGLVSPGSSGEPCGCCCQRHNQLAPIMVSGKPAALCLIVPAETETDLHIAVPQSFLHSPCRPKPTGTLQLRLRPPNSSVTFTTMLLALIRLELSARSRVRIKLAPYSYSGPTAGLNRCPSYVPFFRSA